VQLILPDGRVYSAAHAVLQSLALGRRSGRLLACYERSRLFRRCAEAAYRFVAANRSWLPRL
jgi:predicted DCC family thiol-disulfide oxidoreductase YuxK